MTIGIAAFGPRSGHAILEGLSAAESIGRGAVGGFVSFAVLCVDGRLRRAETQTGGSHGLGVVPEEMLAGRIAALMSSAANRPEPLAQFVLGADGVGLVTGHRFPNMPGRSGVALNQQVLAEMAKGLSPATAIASIVADNADADAGLIAIDLKGRVGSADTRRLERLADRNSAKVGSRRTGGLVAVRHNGIRPFRGLALVVAEIALAVIMHETAQSQLAQFCAGIPVVTAAADKIFVDNRGHAVRLEVSGGLGEGTRHLGMGSGVPLFHSRDCIGFTIYEPFLTVRDGTLISIDGHQTNRVPFLPSSPGVKLAAE
jgi:hypothetical protein